MSEDLVETIRLWDSVMLASADRPLPAAVLQRGSVLRPPAGGAAAERLGGLLPPSYAAFLSYSDGAYANGCGLVTKAGAFGLLPADRIGRLAAAALGQVGLWVETFGVPRPKPGRPGPTAGTSAASPPSPTPSP